MRIVSAAFTHVGRRNNNEDAHCREPELGVYAVADGMGGYEGGEVASRLAIDTIVDFVRRNIADDDVTWPYKKCLRPELRGDATLERLLIEEARLGARLVHRNLVQVHDLGVDAGVYYVRMDLVEGGDLATRLKRDLPPLPIALLLADEVLSALAYLHGVRGDDDRPLGLLHRDVSPANILVSRAGDVKLADLGLAKATLLRDQTHANVRKGTYAYMSPEQVRGEPLGGKSDLFSVGVLLHELLTGARPFDGDTPHETMRRIVEDAPAFGALSPALRDLIAACLAKDPAARPSDAEALRRLIAAQRRTIDDVGAIELCAWFFA